MDIIHDAIAAIKPDTAVKGALEKMNLNGHLYCAAVGKAGWQMARAAEEVLGDRIEKGIVITKYGHVKEPLAHFRCYEAGHPVPDENTWEASKALVNMADGLDEGDVLLFLLSGGGSSLFEIPLVTPEETAAVTEEMLKSGADITEMNTVRKHLSAVKGGRFAMHCAPAEVKMIVLSDVVGDRLDMIASGPAVPDESTCEDALNVVKKYHLHLSENAMNCLRQETPKRLDHVEAVLCGSVRKLAQAAKNSAEAHGYRTWLLTDCMDCEAREAGRFLASIARTYAHTKEKLAVIAGGETVVHVKGRGLGGRNQELALAAAAGISGLENVCVFSFGSDGTDGPTDAAGGYVSGMTKAQLENKGIRIDDVLEDNDAYHALAKTGGLVKTGPTGTNVNDVSVILIN